MSWCGDVREARRAQTGPGAHVRAGEGSHALPARAQPGEHSSAAVSSSKPLHPRMRMQWTASSKF